MVQIYSPNEDLYLTCVDCGVTFVFEPGEQVFYKSKGLSIPKRCPDCRRKRRLTLVPDTGKAGCGDG